MKKIIIFLTLMCLLISCSGNIKEFKPAYREDIKNYEFIKDFYQNKAYKEDRLTDDELLWFSEWEQSPVYGTGYLELTADKRNVFCFLGGVSGIPVRLAVLNIENGFIRHVYTQECKSKFSSEKLLKLDERESFFILYNIYPKDWGDELPYWFIYDLRNRKLIFMAPSKARQAEEDGTDQLTLGVAETSHGGMKDLVVVSSLGETVEMYYWDIEKREYIKAPLEDADAQE